MGSWVGVLVKMTNEAWPILGRHGVEATSSRVVPWILVDAGSAFGDVEALGRRLSLALDSQCIAFAAQSASDAYGIWSFDRGERVRALEYTRDGGGWTRDEGEPAAWENVFFFDPKGSTADDGSRWPAMIDDDLSLEDVARYGTAKRTGDARSVMDLLRLSSLSDVARMCAFFDCDGQKVDGKWKPVKKSFLASLFGKSES